MPDKRPARPAPINPGRDRADPQPPYHQGEAHVSRPEQVEREAARDARREQGKTQRRTEAE